MQVFKAIFLSVSACAALCLSCGKNPSSPTQDPAETLYLEVDLGLSVKWCDRNVGALNEEDCGMYFAWGESVEKEEFSWENYILAAGSSTRILKYCSNSNFGVKDDASVLEKGDDAASVVMGDGWRTPTQEEWDELFKMCSWTWTGNGYRISSRIPGFTDNGFFLPAAGYCEDVFLNGKHSEGFYWSSSVCAPAPDCAWALSISSSSHEWTDGNRHLGFSVRAVR